jgi:Flp pilus assembly protein TadB
MGIIQSMIQAIGKSGFNLLFILMMGGSLFLFLKGLFSQRRTSVLFDLSKGEVKEKKEKKKIDLMYFKRLKANLKTYYTFKENKKRAEHMYLLVLIAELVLFIILVLAQNFFLAIFFPLMIHWFVNKALELMSDNIHYYIQKELPLAIKHLIKTMTKTNDLKSIMLETSNTLQEPLRSKFLDLSRKMVTENYEKSLMDFGEELGDTWIYAFVFLLLSYKEQSKKSDVINNLTNLADMIEKENYLKEKSITDRKATVILNYCLGGFGVAGLFLNLIFNKHSIDFFFNSMTGMLALIVGFCAILGTFIINLLLSKKTF